MDRLMVSDLPAMLDIVVRATVLLSAALALAWLARGGPAGGRHLLWTMTFAFLLALPVLSLAGPSWELPLLPSQDDAPRQALLASAPVGVVANGLIPSAVPEPGPAQSRSGARPTAAVTAREPFPPARSLPLPFLFWALGCAAGLGSLATDGLRFARLVRAADPLRDRVGLGRANEVRRRLGIRRDVRLFLSPATTTPMTGGLLNPVILLPESAREWSAERWKVVLAHEMIHARRHDVLRQFMVRAALALFWFHPLIRVAARLAATAREEACDEEVLALGTRPSRYATHLLALAGGLTTRRPVLSLPMARQHSQLERRIMTILRPRRPRPSATFTALIALATGGAGVSAAFAHPVRTSSSDTVVAVVTARIGSTGLGDDADEYIFGDVTSVAADRDGRIYVADRVSPSVRVFRADGEFMAWIGREGEGPGEFTWPVDILPADDGRLFVRGQRVTTFATGDSSEYPDLVVGTWRIPPYANSSSWRARLVEGVYYYPHLRSRRDEPVDYFYMKYGPEGIRGDTAKVPAVGNLGRQFTAFYMVSQGSGRMVDGLNIAPFAPRADWDMTGRGTIIVGDGETYELREFDQDGRLLRAIAGPERERRAVPRAERADSMRALEARIDSLPVPLGDVLHVAPEILRGEIPDSLPAFIGVHVGARDRFWVERWPQEGRGSWRYYDVLEYDGRHAGTVVAPVPLMADPPPFFGEEVIVGVVADPVTEVHTVVVLGFRMPG